MSFLQTSISMAATVATQVRPKMATCIDNWYFKTNELQDKRNLAIIETMAQYKKFHPTSVLLAYIENVCGKFKAN
ncbi:MAG: hypothetical protein JJ964_05570 [Rhizobiales bacterium]|nr:hypothetical protein [Hyphomicrobiales bacterium]